MANHHHIPGDRDAGLEAFLHLVDPDIALPELSVEPEEINLRLEFGDTREIPVIIRNLGRGYLHGTIEVSDPNQALELSTNHFFIDSKSEKETLIQLRIDTNRLESGRSYQTEIVCSTNTSAGQTSIPVSVLAEDYKKIARERAKRALTIIGITAFLACVLIVYYFFPYRYNYALSIMEEGRFEEASVLFLQLGGFRDSEEMYRQNKYHASLIAGGVEYYIDYTSGDIPIGELPIGAKVVDLSWEWEYLLGRNYSDTDWDGDPTPPGEKKPVTWLVVARDHYGLDEAHITLLAEELVGVFAFDDSTERDHEYTEYGYNHWGKSGTHSSADCGLRPWLNSSGIHTGEGFYQAFSESFKGAVLTTDLPNKEWQNGSAYSTSDNVFIPSTTELGDTDHVDTYRIGDVYAYFSKARDEERVAMMVGEGWYKIVEKEWGEGEEEFLERWGIDGNNWFYWTRSPGSGGADRVRFVLAAGAFYDASANFNPNGVRPALNLKADTMVSEIRK